MPVAQSVSLSAPAALRTPPRTTRTSAPKRPSTTVQRMTRSRARQAPPVQSSSRSSPIQSSSLSPAPPETDARSTGDVDMESRPASQSFVPRPMQRYATPDFPPIMGLESELLEHAEPRTPLRKRKEHPTPEPELDDSMDKGPLLSEYMCPICLSSPKNAIITPCGHILCGSCLYGAITARPAARSLCPVCRTLIPNLRFVAPDTRSNMHTPLNVINRPTPEDGVINLEEEEEKLDPARSGVIGLEILTLANL